MAFELLSKNATVFGNNTQEILRIAIPRPLISPSCALTTVLPSSDCLGVGWLVNMSLMFGQVAFGKRKAFRVVPASGWAFTGDRPSPADGSVLGLLERGKADFAPPVAFLTEARAKRLNFSIFVQYESLCFVQKKLSAPTKTLSVEILLKGPNGIWFWLLVCLALDRLLTSVLLRNAYRRVEMRTVSLEDGALLEVRRERRLLEPSPPLARLQARTRLLVSFVVSVILAMLANYVFMIFQGVKEERSTEVQSVNDLVEGMLDGSALPVFDSPVYAKLMLKAYQGSQAVCQAALRKTPPRIVLEERRMMSVLLSDSGDSPRHVLVGESLLPHILRLQIKAMPERFVSHCSQDGSHQFPNVAYFGSQIRQPRFKTSQAMVFREMVGRAKAERFPFAELTPELASQEIVLSMGQISGLLLIATAATILSSVVLALEKASALTVFRSLTAPIFSWLSAKVSAALHLMRLKIGVAEKSC